MKHLNDWLDDPKTDEGERLAQEWLDKFRLLAADKPGMFTEGPTPQNWLDSKVLTCEYEGKRYRCIGASRMGDVWITSNMKALNGYEHRVEVEELSNWERRDQ